MSTWGVSLRIARRDVLRSRWRSLLVVAMVGLPVAATTILTSLIATGSVSAVEAIPATMGTSQALVLPLGRDSVDQSPDGGNYAQRGSGGGDTKPWTAAEVQDLTGGRILPVLNGTTLLERGDRLISVPVRQADLRDPATRGMVDLVSGRLPAKAGEVTVSPAMARDGMTAGTTIALARGDVDATVVGVARPRFGDDHDFLMAYPGTVLDADGAESTFLVARSKPVTWSDVRRLNDSGLVVTSRAVLRDPPPSSEVPEAVRPSDSLSSEAVGVLAIAIASIVLEVVLLAGPAFAVGVARQRRQLALVAATGGSARDVRRVVLAQAVVLGIGAAALGVVVGLVAARLSIPVLRRFGGDMGPWDVAPWQVLSAFVLGALAALGAAWFPARQAARQDVVAVLAGRRGTVRTSRGWPVVGGVLLALGTVGAIASSRPGGETTAAACTVVVVLGMVALTPAILGLVGRTAARMPLPLRLAVRDAARQRSRTAPAVAAVMGAVAGITALALGSSSDFAQSRRDYQPQYAMGTTVVQSGFGSTEGQAAFDKLAKDTSQTFPGRTLEPFARVDGVYDDQGMLESKEPTQLVVVGSGCPTPKVGDTPGDTSTDCDEAAFSTTSTIASPAVVRQLGVPLSASEASAMDQGRILVGDRSLLRPDGTVQLSLVATDDNGTVTAVRTLSPEPAALRKAYGPDYSSERGSTTIMTSATAQRLDLPVQLNGGVLSAGPALSKADEQRLTKLAPASEGDPVYTERGFQESYTIQFVALGLAGLLTVLVGTLTAVGLALSDARPDMATLAAVGARPRTRRTMAAATALVIGLLGTLTGVLVGFVPGWSVSRPLTSTGDLPPVFDVPWTLLGGIGLGVPLLAALASLLVVRSRLPLTRRIG